MGVGPMGKRMNKLIAEALENELMTQEAKALLEAARSAGDEQAVQDLTTGSRMGLPQVKLNPSLVAI